MKVYDTRWHFTGKIVSICDAIKRVLDDSCEHGEGELEALRRRVDAQEEFMAELIEHMVETNKLSMSDFHELTNCRFSEAHDDD